MDEGAWTPCAGSLLRGAMFGGGEQGMLRAVTTPQKRQPCTREKLWPTHPACRHPAAVLYVLTMPSAVLGEYWQAVVRANVRTVGQPLVDAPGVEDVAACVVRGIEIVTGCARSRGAAEGQQSAAAAPLWRPSGEGAPLGRRVWA